jgi:hypothetical protein
MSAGELPVEEREKLRKAWLTSDCLASHEGSFAKGYRAALAAREEPEWTWSRLYARLDAALLDHKRAQGDLAANEKLWAAHKAVDTDLFGSELKELPDATETTDADRLASALWAIDMLHKESDPVIAAAQHLVQNALGDDVLWEAIRPLKLVLDRCPASRGEGPDAVVRDTEREHEPTENERLLRDELRRVATLLHFATHDANYAFENCERCKRVMGIVPSRMRRNQTMHAGHAEVLAKALDQFFAAHLSLDSIAIEVDRLRTAVEPTLQALGYPKEETA